MTALNLTPIERHDHLTPKDFYQHFYLKNKPVILKTFAKDWPALSKWTYDYFKSRHGRLPVPIQSEAFANTGRSYLTASETMTFGDYLDLIATLPTKKRMFLFNIFKHIPELCEDFSYPEWNIPFVRKHPFMFFGGATSFVDIHYDLDLSHVFITQFAGKKDVILFAPEYSSHLYRHPLTVSCNIDLS